MKSAFIILFLIVLAVVLLCQFACWLAGPMTAEEIEEDRRDAERNYW